MFAACFCMAALCSGVMELNLACAAAIASAFIVLVVVVVVLEGTIVVFSTPDFGDDDAGDRRRVQREWWVVLGSEQIKRRKPKGKEREREGNPQRTPSRTIPNPRVRTLTRSPR